MFSNSNFVQTYFVLCCIALRSPTNLNPCVGVACVVGEVEHEGRAMVKETLALENGGACAVAANVANVTTTLDWSLNKLMCVVEENPLASNIARVQAR